MLQRVDDVMLMAYVDGEVDSDTAQDIERAIAKDAGLARRARAMRDSAAFARAAFAEVLHEPVPERLVNAIAGLPRAAVAGEPAAAAPGSMAAAPPAAPSNVVPLRPRSPLRRIGGWAVAASLFAVGIALGATYTSGALQRWTGVSPSAGVDLADASRATGDRWIDHVAGFYREYATTLQREQRLLVDFSGEHMPELEQWFSQRLNRRLNVPDLSQHGYAPQGGRMLIINGRPAAHLLYVGRTGDLIGLVIAFSEGAATPGRLAQRDGVNIVYWRDAGYAYGFVGTQPREQLWRMADQTWSSLSPI